MKLKKNLHLKRAAGNSPDFLAQKLRNARCQVFVFSLALFSVIRPILQTMRSFVLLERWDPVFPTFWGPGSETSLEQALVFDAGSSGTRPEPRGLPIKRFHHKNQWAMLKIPKFFPLLVTFEVYYILLG